MSETGIAIGEMAPAFSLPDTSGAEHGFGEDPGAAAATVVYWTCNHCPYALAWHDRMLDVARDYGERGVRVLAINSNDAERYPADSLEAMAARVEADGGWPHPYLHDADQGVARGFGALKTPDVFLFGPDSRLAYRGAPDKDYDRPELRAGWLRDALDAVLDGREPVLAETDAVGCGIKWKQ